MPANGGQGRLDLVTGPVAVVNEVLRGFGAYASNFEDHPAMILVGDPVSGKWTRFYGFSDPKDVLAKVEELRAARGASRPAS
jgi:protein SCO1/2